MSEYRNAWTEEARNLVAQFQGKTDNVEAIVDDLARFLEYLDDDAEPKSVHFDKWEQRGWVFYTFYFRTRNLLFDDEIDEVRKIIRDACPALWLVSLDRA